MSDFDYNNDLKTSFEEAVAFTKGNKSRVRISARELPMQGYDANAVIQVRMLIQLLRVVINNVY